MSEDNQDFIKSANPLIEKQLQEFMKGFQSAADQELDQILKQAENLKYVIQHSNMDKSN